MDGECGIGDRGAPGVEVIGLDDEFMADSHCPSFGRVIVSIFTTLNRLWSRGVKEKVILACPKLCTSLFVYYHFSNQLAVDNL